MKRTACLIFLFTATSALARDVDFSRHIVDLDGKDIPTSQAKDAAPLDLKNVATTALLTERQDPRQTPPDPADKLRRFALALKIHQGGKVDLSAEEIAEVKASIAAAYSALVVGRANEILERIRR
jgi:hypothetical protein